jgi:hypothetical protein
VNEQAKFWSGPAGAGQCKRGGNRPRACDEPWRSRPSAFGSIRGGGTTMRRARKTSWASRTAGSKAKKGKKAESQNWFKPFGGMVQGPEQGGEHAAARQNRRAKCCLTLHSRGGPTARRQAPATGTVYIVCSRGLSSRRRPPLSSNVRRRKCPRSPSTHLLKIPAQSWNI